MTPTDEKMIECPECGGEARTESLTTGGGRVLAVCTDCPWDGWTDNRPDSGERGERWDGQKRKSTSDALFHFIRDDVSGGGAAAIRRFCDSLTLALERSFRRPDRSTSGEGDCICGSGFGMNLSCPVHSRHTDAAPTEREEGPMTDHAKGEGRIARPEKPTGPPDVPASPPPARRAHHQGEDSNDSLAHTLESMAAWVEGGAVLREAARRLRTTRTEEPKDRVRCTCEWAHPVQGYVGLYPAELDPECEVHGAPAGFPDISEWCAVYHAALDEEGSDE